MLAARRERTCVASKKKVFLLNYLSNQHSYTSKIKGEVFKEQFNSLMYWLLCIVSTVSMFSFEPRSGKYNNVPFILWGGYLYFPFLVKCNMNLQANLNSIGLVLYIRDLKQRNLISNMSYSMTKNTHGLK